MEFSKMIQIFAVSIFLLSFANPFIYAKCPLADKPVKENLPVMRANFQKPDIQMPEKAKANFKKGEEPQLAADPVFQLNMEPLNDPGINALAIDFLASELGIDKSLVTVTEAFSVDNGTVGTNEVLITLQAQEGESYQVKGTQVVAPGSVWQFEVVENQGDAPAAEPQRAPRGLIKNGKEYRGNGADHGNKNGWGEVPAAVDPEPEAIAEPEPVPEPDAGIPEPDAPAAEIQGTGVMNYIELEGGFWAITTDDGGCYVPQDLSEDFKVEGLSVSFSANELKDIATIQQWGVPVELMDISAL